MVITGGKAYCSSSGIGTANTTQRSSSSNSERISPQNFRSKTNQQFRFGNSKFGRTATTTSKPPYRAQKPTDYGVVKNINKALYFTSSEARQCQLCSKQYKRMVPHFRNTHSNYEVFVSRLSPRMAKRLGSQSQLPFTKYTRPSGMQHLRMMCPFCECDKDFFLPYWVNHIRTHTGEYTNRCIVCKKVISYNMQKRNNKMRIFHLY